MSGGTISGNSSEGDGSAVCVDLGSQFTMSGGVIAGNGTADGTGVYVSADSALAISGAAFISRENRVFMASGVTLTVKGALTPPPGRAYSAFLSPNRYNVGQTLVRAERPYTLAERDLAALPLSDSAYRLYLDRGEGKVDRR
jgi:hypothetical protein